MERLPTWIALDTETASAHGCPHLVELGAVRVVDGELAGRFHALVRPPLSLDALPTSVHGLRDADLEHAGDAPGVLRRFWEWAGARTLVAHAARSDARVLAFEHRRHGLALHANPFVDSIAIARRAFPEAADHRLETLCRLLGLAGRVPHRALADAELCARVVNAALAKLGPETREALPLRCEAAHVDGPVERAARRPERGTWTLERCAPRPARLSPGQQLLARACAARERVTFLQQDAAGERKREVVPWLVFRRHARDWLEAWDLETRAPDLTRLEAVHHVRLRA